MTKATVQTTEKRASTQGLPSFLTVGNVSRAQSTRSKVGEAQLRKLFEWWEISKPTMKELSVRNVGIQATKLAQEFGLNAPTNGNSFRANLQRVFDQLNFEGETMFLSLRGTEGEKFRVTPETTIWFHPVSSSERLPKAKQ